MSDAGVPEIGREGLAQLLEGRSDEEINQSIPARFEQQVRLHESRLAISTETESITYKALNATANRLARRVLALRGDRSEPVALMFDHGAGARLPSRRRLTISGGAMGCAPDLLTVGAEAAIER